MKSLTNDTAISVAQRALNGLSYRKDLISQNIANIDTPGYLAKEVNFEETLKRVMNDGTTLEQKKTRPGHMSIDEQSTSDFYAVQNRPGGSLRNDGNDVDMDQELIQMTETELKYQTLTNAVSKKLALLKAIASER